MGWGVRTGLGLFCHSCFASAVCVFLGTRHSTFLQFLLISLRLISMCLRELLEYVCMCLRELLEFTLSLTTC